MILYLKQRQSSKIIESYIDLKDFDKIKELDATWFLQKNKYWNGKDAPTYYVRATIPTGKRLENGRMTYKGLLLHKFITDSGNGADIHVDHIDHNGLNNRKYNLRVDGADKNTKNRKDKNTNNKSGYRNVCWIKDYNKWCVQLMVDGKNKIVGKFDDIDEAGAFAKDMREKLYGDYQGRG